MLLVFPTAHLIKYLLGSLSKMIFFFCKIILMVSLQNCRRLSTNFVNPNNFFFCKIILMVSLQNCRRLSTNFVNPNNFGASFPNEIISKIVKEVALHYLSTSRVLVLDISPRLPHCMAGDNACLFL